MFRFTGWKPVGWGIRPIAGVTSKFHLPDPVPVVSLQTKVSVHAALQEAKTVAVLSGQPDSLVACIHADVDPAAAPAASDRVGVCRCACS